MGIKAPARWRYESGEGGLDGGGRICSVCSALERELTGLFVVWYSCLHSSRTANYVNYHASDVLRTWLPLWLSELYRKSFAVLPPKRPRTTRQVEASHSTTGDGRFQLRVEGRSCVRETFRHHGHYSSR